MAETVCAIISIVLAVASLVISTMSFMEKGFLFNNAYIWASSQNRAKMNKGPYYRQTAITFVIAAIAASIAIVTAMFFFQANQPPESIKKMIENNKESYDWTANFYYKDFTENKEECLSYSFLEGDKILNYKDMSDSRCIYLEKSEIDMFSIVDDSYYVDGKALDRVYVYDNFVALCNENGRASCVYSVDGTAPIWSDCPKDDEPKINTYKLIGNWYYVVVK